MSALRQPLARAALRAVAAGGLALAVVVAVAAPAPVPSAVGPARVVTAEVKGVITSGTTEYLVAALARAKAEGAAAVVVTLDTPGGALDATREVVQAMLASEVPIVVWVGPAGARAGSAGVFLTLAAHVAAMHPTSNIGAAHPVTGSGRDVAEEAGKEMARKVENDTAAFARSIAAARGRNADWAEKAVRESVSVTADEAVKLRVVDLVAPDLDAVLAGADGRKVATAAGERTLAVRGAARIPFEPTVRQRLLMFLADPNVMAILMLVGLLGIAVEFYHPGAILPGVVGGFCLFLAFLAMRVIPVNVGAVLLVLVGVGLMIAEGYVPSHGVAVVGGAALVVLGTLFFIDTSPQGDWFDPSALRVSPWVVWPTPAAIAGLIGFMAWKIARGRRMPLQLGAPALVGEVGEALTEVGPAGGEVFVHGEYWHARSAAAIPRGARVRVSAIIGLTLTVVAEDRAAG
ncbi:NfeD family protein [Anaeromyxobacter oryzae]|uniref:Serine protease n=1 Tax=Anaeromyxobacter oryzae TaxID=2918170 RepID=A0ABM7WQ56_9BACT|nr:nodulation protein NfeD [Anaeromyxobacter oryzae]BDG01599.1 serine protease [Anaeromyxobacter oryzae]